MECFTGANQIATRKSVTWRVISKQILLILDEEGSSTVHDRYGFQSPQQQQQQQQHIAQ
jgi:hypothetical protein